MTRLSVVFTETDQRAASLSVLTPQPLEVSLDHVHNLDVEFRENDKRLTTSFGEIERLFDLDFGHVYSFDGYERGYEIGYRNGSNDTAEATAAALKTI